MKYNIVNTPISGSGHITILLGRGDKIMLDKKGGELTESQVAALDIFKTADKKAWVEDTVFVRLVKAGRLQITGDKKLEELFGTAIPKRADPRRAEKSAEERLAAMEAEMKERDAKYLELKQLVEQNAAAQAEAAKAKPAAPFAPAK